MTKIEIDLGSWFPGRASEAARRVRGSSLRGSVIADFLIDILEQIEGQVKPPRIEEPRQWGVVQAGLKGYTHRRNFVRVSNTPGAIRGIWVYVDPIGSSSARYDWVDLIDPALLREGVES